ncbi:DUF726-domain-containing protein [Laetiporus sulphureus 93-53]|uniref:DUF726-domain-containing protein n=1 Tax=Laetiporus sulphureus 93-53 TaxID=1314785 RepID=A0A165FDB2_9APHY|nr:DUF726-domain-containing protein [Laetiporus sulphureus 93-53]KZT08796.1 DUF726-domain-containing protein [Laetiporus sulphureus 93-53]
MPVLAPPPIAPIEPDVFDDDDEGWQDMPVIRDRDDIAGGLDEEDQKKYHYVPPVHKSGNDGGGNATGTLLDVDYRGNEWRSKVDQNENEYTRLRVNEEDESDEVHLRTKYLFDEDKAMTPLSQMQATKDLLTEAQRIAYVGLCALTSREMSAKLKAVNRKELKKAIENMELWALRITGRLYYHMELSTEEQKMIDSLAVHGIEAKDLVPALMTTHTVANPEYDPAEARRQAEEQAAAESARLEAMENESADVSESIPITPTPSTPKEPIPTTTPKPTQTTTRVLQDTSSSVPGVSTHLSAADEKVTLDIRWTVLCDLFLVLIADSVYDARSRVLLENVALKLGLGWLDVVRFERRVSEALEIEEGTEKLEQEDIIKNVQKATRKRRYMMLGLATIGGGLVIGLSAGLLAPVIGAGLGAAFATIGITGTTSFLAGTAGAAVITTGGVLTGSGVAVSGMARRTRYVRTFDILPLHNNKRVNCILTVPGFMTGPQDDVRLPFSVLDPVVGDVFSVLWEPEMIRETGSALKILTSEVLTQLAQTALQATVMTALMSALQWPIILTKLGYLIDNPWSNALDRAKAAGLVLADVLLHRHLGVRPITLIGFSLGARVIFYALLELAKRKAFGIVEDVFLLGATVTAPLRTWLEVRSIISGRFVNGYARNDWVLNYLFRATSGGLNTVAGLRPVKDVPGLENVDVTDKISGHMSYRTFMPLILDQLGFPVSADYFDEPVEPDFTEDRIVVREGEENLQKKSWFHRKKKTPSTPAARVSHPPSAGSFSVQKEGRTSQSSATDDELPPRETTSISASVAPSQPSTPALETSTATDEASPVDSPDSDLSTAHLPARAGFDFDAIKDVIGNPETNLSKVTRPSLAQPTHEPTHRSESVPLPSPKFSDDKPPYRTSFDVRPAKDQKEPVAGPSSLFLSELTSKSHSSRLHSAADEDESASDGESSLAEQTLHTGYRPAAFSSDITTSTWPGNESTSTSTFGVFADYRPPSADVHSQNALSNGGGAISSVASSTYSTLGTSLPSRNPFLSLSDTSLAFGGVDGSITYSPSPLSVERDPWTMTTASRTIDDEASKKSASIIDLNPWRT